MRSTKKKNRIFILPLLIFVLYFALQIANLIGSTAVTVAAVEITHNQSFETSGNFIFNAVNVEHNTSGQQIRYICQEGERISEGNSIAAIFSDSSAASISDELTKVREDIEFWESANETSIGLSDNAKIDDQISHLIIELNQNSGQVTTSEMLETSNELKTTILRRNVTTEGSYNVKSQIETLRQTETTLLNSLEQISTWVKAPITGYFTQQNNIGASSLYQSLNEFTLDDLRMVQKTSGDILPNSVGKLIEDFSWYYAVETTADNANLLSEGRTVKIKFTSIEEEEVSAKVERIEKYDDGSAMIVFNGNASMGNLVSQDFVSSEIIVKTYQGIKIPTEAVRILDGKIGTYVSNGSIYTFKEIEPILETEDYYIIEKELKPNAIVVYEEIVISANNLSGEKVIE